MSAKMRACLLTLTAAGALLAAGAASAATVELISLKQNAAKAPPSVYKFINGTDLTFPVSDFATVASGVHTFVDGWALIDQTNCVQINLQNGFDNSVGDPNGVWHNHLVTAELGSGACPGMKFVFAGITFTWTGEGGSGTVDRVRTGAYITDISHAQQVTYGLPKQVKIRDTVTITHQ